MNEINIDNINNIDAAINTNDGICDRDDVRIRCWGIGRDTIYLTIKDSKYTLSKGGLTGPGTAMSNYYAVTSAFYKDGEHGVDVIHSLRETAESETFHRWRDELLELINELEEMVTVN